MPDMNVGQWAASPSSAMRPRAICGSSTMAISSVNTNERVLNAAMVCRTIGAKSAYARSRNSRTDARSRPVGSSPP